ncbi:MAG: hypothetical protein RR577_00700 [Erysipelotrichales bacterium]
MKKKKLIIIISVLVASVLIITYKVYSSFKLQNDINNTKLELKDKELSDRELEYLLEKKYLNEEQAKSYREIKYFSEKDSYTSHKDLNVLSKKNEYMNKIDSSLKNDLQETVSTSQKQLTNRISKLNTSTTTLEKDKKKILKEITFDPQKINVSGLIKKEIELDTNNSKLNILTNKIEKENNMTLFNEIPTLITKEEIQSIGISYKNGSYNIDVSHPPLCAIYDAKPFTRSIYNSSKKDSNRRLKELQNKIRYSLTLFNSNYNGITTLNDNVEDKDYIIYVGGVSNKYKKDCSDDTPGGAAVLIAYDYVDKRIISITGTQNTYPFIINRESISFN